MTCILSESSNGQRQFFVLDPLSGRGPLLLQRDLKECSHWSLSPDAKSIGCLFSDYLGEIEIINLKGNEERRVSVKGTHFTDLHWAPDNVQVFVSNFSSVRARDEIGIVDLNGDFKLLYTAPYSAATIGAPSPSPDGHYLAFEELNFDFNVALLENY